ncbi:MAG: NnrS family protein [Deltaproteobacteria bacterium]|nr:NnrS family protein [Deltaproteobacteria bacterium]
MPVVFALGFRPFFLLAGFLAIVLVAAWVVVFVGGFAFDTYYGQLGWHSHEMIFGYTSAVVAGFLLTAVINWTERPTPTGGYLAAMAALWLVGRIMPLFPETLPGWLIALVDLTFLPVVAIGIGVPLAHKGEQRNLVFLLLLSGLFIANLQVHLDLLGYGQQPAGSGVFLGLHIVILLIVIMGGRVIPFFTERALQGVVIKRWPVIEWLAPISALAFLCSELFRADMVVVGACAALAAIVNGIRLASWYTNRFWPVPLLWVLHLGYGWIVMGFCLEAAAAFRAIPPQSTTHAFTAGAIGVLTLGMMARVALGHTARPLRVGPAMAVAFALVNLAAFLRALPPIWYPQWFSEFVILSGAFWCIAFSIFVAIYTPILTQPRIDGRPG